MASKWLKALPSTKGMLNKPNKKHQATSKNGSGKASRITFEKYIAAHDTKPTVILTTSSANELVRNLEASNRIEIDEVGRSGKSEASYTHKKRSAVSPLETDRRSHPAGIKKKQKTQDKNNYSIHM